MTTDKLDWEEVRALIEQHAGPVQGTVKVSEERNSEVSLVVHADRGSTFVKGRRADHPDLPAILDTLRLLQAILCPDIDLKQAEQRWLDYTGHPELFAGTSLLHTEWTPGNVLMSQRAYLVDWAWPTRGAAWIDPACLVVWLIASGHVPESAEGLAAQVPSWHAAPRRRLTNSRWHRRACGPA